MEFYLLRTVHRRKAAIPINKLIKNFKVINKKPWKIPKIDEGEDAGNCLYWMAKATLKSTKLLMVIDNWLMEYDKATEQINEAFDFDEPVNSIIQHRNLTVVFFDTRNSDSETESLFSKNH